MFDGSSVKVERRGRECGLKGAGRGNPLIVTGPALTLDVRSCVIIITEYRKHKLRPLLAFALEQA